MTSQIETKKILIVDDNPGVRQMLRLLLPCFSSEIIECSDGNEAMNLYKLHRPGIVLMDLRLKTTDGITTTKNIKQSFPGAKIIMLSWYGDAWFKAAAKQAGAIGYVLKDNLNSVVGIVQQQMA